ncbi:hypothetical protein BK022_01725 [Methylorubrum extorquens]|uniref:Uncharacterized protein n=1 Tax=Methylorubrum extorquens TaxID=408 RepID=A0A1S1P9R0_METEX|nr:hypothetical protein BK022_01725 [Methylorubrum extorquens]
MAKVQDPILFSTHFGIDTADLEKAGLVDPLLDVDTPLFIDPVLLEKSGNERIKAHSIARFRKHFDGFVRLIAMSEREGDAAWKAAQRQLDLSEPPENGLGYGGSGRSGNSRPDDVRDKILQTSKEIIRLGVKDPEMISLMGFFEEDVGPDTISDFTTSVIIEDLAAITEEFCNLHGIPVASTKVSDNHKLPQFQKKSGKTVPIVLVPTDIVRELPVANDWSDIQDAAMRNAEIRERVNQLLGGIARPTATDMKHALRGAALGSSDNFMQFLATIKENVENYDPNLDALGYYKAKDLIAHQMDGLKQVNPYDLSAGSQVIMALVHDTIGVFKRHVEHGNLWEELWIGAKPKRERASQLIYYAIADSFCKANEVDISPEANMGGGPIDFKFSRGYTSRVLVEMKRSGGSVVHGYQKQLEFYKNASQTDYAVFVVIDYGDMGGKLAAIQKIQRERIEAGERASDIIVIDAQKKASASKRD